MITLQLTEVEAARVFYAIANEAHENHMKAQHEIKEGTLSAASGRIQTIYEAVCSECTEILRKIEKAREEI